MANKSIFIFFLTAVTIFCSGLHFGKKNNISPENLEKIFREKLQADVIYTKVPRGLIISVDGESFFDGCDTKLKFSAYNTLDIISNILKDIPNNCVIEDHTTTSNCRQDVEKWEISAVRSSNIADYLMKRKEVPFDKIFYIGYGDIMPLKTNISSDILKLKNRVDFVIIDYEAKR